MGSEGRRRGTGTGANVDADLPAADDDTQRVALPEFLSASWRPRNQNQNWDDS